MFDKGARLLGHPIHQMLIVFPLGLLATSIAFDIVFLSTGAMRWADVAYWMIAAGLIGGAIAAVFGLIDWIALPSGTRAKMVGAWHGIGNAVVLVLFLISWLMRRAELPGQPGVAAIVLSFIGVGLALVTGWLGGELVDRMGVGVDKGAHADSPNSLSGRPATDSVPPARRVGLGWGFRRGHAAH
jgi:uncharacterized membrane protein